MHCWLFTRPPPSDTSSCRLHTGAANKAQASGKPPRLKQDRYAGIILSCNLVSRNASCLHCTASIAQNQT